MKFNDIIEQLGKAKAIKLASGIAKNNNLQWNKNIEVILIACCNNLSLAPKIGRIFTRKSSGI